MIVAFVAGFFACVFLFAYLQDRRKLRIWECKKDLAVEAEAIVTRIEIATISVDRIIYEFSNQKGEIFSGSFNVSSNTGQYPPGTEISVFYDRENPKESITCEYLEAIRKKGKRSLILAVFAFGIAVAGSVLRGIG